MQSTLCVQHLLPPTDRTKSTVAIWLNATMLSFSHPVFTWTYVNWVQPGSSASVSHGRATAVTALMRFLWKINAAQSSNPQVLKALYLGERRRIMLTLTTLGTAFPPRSFVAQPARRGSLRCGRRLVWIGSSSLLSSFLINRYRLIAANVNNVRH